MIREIKFEYKNKWKNCDIWNMHYKRSAAANNLNWAGEVNDLLTLHMLNLF